ncbi:hypothetical protein J1614_000864, partial [Plenodomus biglobosus]
MAPHDQRHLTVEQSVHCHDRKISTASTITHSPPASPESPRHSAAIHPSQKTASRTLLEAPPRQPYRRLGEGSSASIDSGVEHMSLQEATSLTKPSVPPFLNTPWDHPLHWTMPSPAILADVFPPPLASAILAAHPERNTRCFCSIVLTIAQALLQPPNCKNLLRDTPTSLADCLTTLPHIFQPKALKVFTLECERLASLYGPTQLEHRIVTRTFAEHVSEFIEQLPLMGVAAYRSAAHQLDVEARAQTLAQARVQTRNQTEPANTRDTARKHVYATLHRVWNRIGYKASTTTQCNDQAPPLVPAPA